MGPETEDTPRARRPSKAWMIIFTDLVSLMLTFFVMLFAMSNVKVDKWDSMIDAAPWECLRSQAPSGCPPPNAGPLRSPPRTGGSWATPNRRSVSFAAPNRRRVSSGSRT